MSDEAIGYHLTKIEKGVCGELSKILEETLEAIDAEAQGSNVMVLNELSDIVGAINLYLEAHHPSVNIQDLIKMSDITARAFRNGRRT